MQEQQKIDFKKIRSQYFLKYGVEVDDITIVVALIVIEATIKQFTGQNRKLDLAIEKMNAASERINAANKTLMADSKNPRAQAFWFGMGQWGLGLILGIAIISLFYCMHIHKQQEADKTSVQLQWYRKFYDAFQNGDKKTFDDFIKSNPRPEDN